MRLERLPKIGGPKLNPGHTQADSPASLNGRARSSSAGSIGHPRRRPLLLMPPVDLGSECRSKNLISVWIAKSLSLCGRGKTLLLFQNHMFMEQLT